MRAPRSSQPTLCIARLRRRIAANKGVAERARAGALVLRLQAETAERQIAADLRDIQAMGGKVRR